MKFSYIPVVVVVVSVAFICLICQLYYLQFDSRMFCIACMCVCVLECVCVYICVCALKFVYDFSDYCYDIMMWLIFLIKNLYFFPFFQRACSARMLSLPLANCLQKHTHVCICCNFAKCLCCIYVTFLFSFIFSLFFFFFCGNYEFRFDCLFTIRNSRHWPPHHPLPLTPLGHALGLGGHANDLIVQQKRQFATQYILLYILNIHIFLYICI